MSTDLHFEDRPGVISGMPDPMDLADLWLAHALSWLLDACDVPVAQRRVPVEAGDLTLGLVAREAVDNAASASRATRCIPARRAVRRTRGGGPARPTAEAA